jgi:hypothetical protein
MNDLHYNFLDRLEGEGYCIELKNLFEGICQGGPMLGNLKINGKYFSSDYFGGPMHVYKEKLYIPKFKKSLFHGPGFVLVSIDILSKEQKKLTTWKDMVLVKSIKDDVITYFTNIENINESSCNI